MIEFTPWPKIPRLYRDITITEKIDGTNAALHIVPSPNGDVVPGTAVGAIVNGEFYAVAAQSRNRLITPDADNYGFAAYVNANAEALVTLLGPGLHFGEWYGKGIQRRYDLPTKRFALFNVERWVGLSEAPAAAALCLDVVPTLYHGPFSELSIRQTITDLRVNGSRLVPGFVNPEGIVIRHSAAKQTFKVLIENDDRPKGVVAL